MGPVMWIVPRVKIRMGENPKGKNSQQSQIWVRIRVFVNLQSLDSDLVRVLRDFATVDPARVLGVARWR